MSDIKRITLFKIKPNYDFEEFLKDGLGNYDHLEDEAAGFEVYISYVNAGGAERTEEDIPWLKFLNSAFQEKKYKFKARNKFPRALAAIKVKLNEAAAFAYFVATFGQHGDNNLERASIVPDFGIRVGMNICDVDRLRRVQTSIHESVSQQTERQASVGANLKTFGIDIESEFLRTIAGNVKASYADIVESFRGKDSIAVKLPREKKLEWGSLVDICRRLDERYHSTDYRETDFKVYDLLRHENDPETIEKLDAAVTAKVSVRDFSKLHLSPPEFIETEEINFAYQEKSGDVTPPLYEDLRIEDVVNVPRRRLANLTADTMRNWKVLRYDVEQDRTFPKWNAYQCLVAEIDLDGKTYVLVNGQWREISPELKTRVNNYFDDHDMVTDLDYLPNDVHIYDPISGQNREDVYNAAVASAHPKIFLFDKAKIEIAGRRQYEVCDLFHSDGHLVHVKRFSSGAASISHLFVQTKMYSHAFVSDEKTRVSMREWIESNGIDENKGKLKDTFLSRIPEKKSELNEKDYTVVLCILHNDQDFSLKQLPFMALYELMLSHRFLTEDRGFNVVVVLRYVTLG